MPDVDVLYSFESQRRLEKYGPLASVVKQLDELQGSCRREAVELACSGLQVLGVEIAHETNLAWSRVEEWVHSLSEMYPGSICDQSNTDAGPTLRCPPAFAIGSITPFIASGRPPRRVPFLFELQHQSTISMLQPIEADESATSDALRSLLHRVIDAFSPAALRITLVDERSSGAPFAEFTERLAKAGVLLDGRVLTSYDDARKATDELSTMAATRIAKVLGKQHQSIIQYNQSAAVQQPVHFVFWNGLGARADRERLLDRRDPLMAALETLARTGVSAGIYIISAGSRLIPGAMDFSRPQPAPASSSGRPDVPDAWLWESHAGERIVGIPVPTPASVDAALSRLEAASQVTTSVSLYDLNGSTTWNGDASEEIAVPVGVAESGEPLTLRFDSKTRTHALVVGRTGSGKSTLLHALIMSIAQSYSPDEVEMYLLDFKQVEFKGYAPTAGSLGLPHATVIAINSDPEFGVSVLHQLEHEIGTRAEAFKKVGATSLAEYRDLSHCRAPRMLIVMDEFQRLFSGNADEADEARRVLDIVAREGRSYGIHLLLSTQTFRSSDLRPSTLAQASLRLALRCDEDEALDMLGPDGARLMRQLSPQGEVILQDRGSHPQTMNVARVAYLSREERAAGIQRLSLQRDSVTAGPVVFDGDSPAKPEDDSFFRGLLEHTDSSVPRVPILRLGRPIAVDGKASFGLRRDGGRNLVVFGNDTAGAVGTLLASAAGVALQVPPSMLEFHIINGLHTDDEASPLVSAFADSLRHRTTLHSGPRAHEAIAAIASDLPALADSGKRILVIGLAMHRVLARTEEPSDALSRILRTGPEEGCHLLGWWRGRQDFFNQVYRRDAAYFGGRMLFPVSADDASDLLPSGRLAGQAGALGRNRAVIWDEDEPDRLQHLIPFRLNLEEPRGFIDWLARCGEQTESAWGDS